MDAALTKADGSTVSISELLAGNEALMLSLVLPGSEQVTQANEFNRSIDQLGDRVEEVVHIVTGESAMMTDVTSLASATNATWSVYLDKKGLCQEPADRASDAVVVVDPGMHVTFSQASSAAMLDIVESVDAIKGRGPNSFGSYFGLLLGPELFLFLLRASSKRVDVP